MPSGWRARACEPNSLHVPYHRYTYDRKRRCLSAKILPAANVEGSGCQPGLAFSEKQYLANFFDMLALIANGETCGRKSRRSLAVDEIHQHATYLADRVAKRFEFHSLANKVVRVAAIVLAALVTLAPCGALAWKTLYMRESPSIRSCSLAITAASACMLILAVARRHSQSSLHSRIMRDSSLNIVLSDVLESGTMKRLRDRARSHLRAGNLHAAFELNKPDAHVAIEKVFGSLVIAGCVALAFVAVHAFDVRESVAVLRAVGGGGVQFQRSHVVDAVMLMVSLPISVVSWQEIVRVD